MKLRRLPQSSRTLIMFLLCVASLFTAFYSQAEDLSKLDKLKAAYLFNFSKYINWPKDAFAHDSAPIRLCLQASEDFVAFARALTEGRKVGQQKRQVEIVTEKDLENCHIRYVSSDDLSVTPISHSTLVVAANREIRAMGTSVWFYRDGPKLRFEVDLNKVQDLNLNISSELLKLARIK